MLTKEQLGLNDKQYKGLHATLAALKAGTIVHIEDTYMVPDDKLGAQIFFNMSTWQSTAFKTDIVAKQTAKSLGYHTYHRGYYDENSNYRSYTENCGSVCCIGGTAEYIMDEKHLFEDCEYYDEEATSDSMNQLHLLFYPWDDPRYDCVVFDGADITKEQAIQALASYLETGDAQWPSFYTPKEDEED
jgi:hypothetical protein